MTRRSLASLVGVVLVGAGCTGPTPPDAASPPVPPAPAATPPTPFGSRQVSLGCTDGGGVRDGEPSAEIVFGLLETPSGSPPPRAEDVGLRLPPGFHWYFRKEPLSLPPGTAEITLSVSGSGQALAWVPYDVWTSGGRPDLATWAASSLTLRSCPDRSAMFLGGMLAADLTTCIHLTVSQAGRSDHTVQRRLDGTPCEDRS